MTTKNKISKCKCKHDWREFVEVKTKTKDYLGRRTVICIKCYKVAPDDIVVKIVIGDRKIKVVGLVIAK